MSLQCKINIGGERKIEDRRNITLLLVGVVMDQGTSSRVNKENQGQRHRLGDDGKEHCSINVE